MADPVGEEKRNRIAMLIDGDNAQPSLSGEILAEASKYGILTIRRIYGDWTETNMGGWKEKLHTYAIQPIQQFRYTIGKNATDSAMIIDAMDIVYSGAVSGFCIVSSDSDYTRLATRIREKGFFVMGIGRKITPRAFVNACDVFLYTENMTKDTQQRAPNGKTSSSSGPVDDTSNDPLPLLRAAFEMAVQDDGWASLGELGSYLRQRDPGFDSRTYGHKRLSSLIRAYSKIFRMKFPSDDDPSNAIYVKLKE